MRKHRAYLLVLLLIGLFRSAPRPTFWAFARWIRPLMAVVYDNKSDSGYQSATSSLSWSHTWTGASLFIVISIYILSANNTVTALTYGGGTPATAVNVGVQNVAGGTGRLECWRVTGQTANAPASGVAGTISATISGSVACAGSAVSYTGVNQSSPTEAFNSTSTLASGVNFASVTITTITDNDMVYAAIASSAISGVVAGQTPRNSVVGSPGVGTGTDEDAGPVHPAGAQAMTFTGVLAQSYAIGGFGIVAVPSPPIPVMFVDPNRRDLSEDW